MLVTLAALALAALVALATLDRWLFVALDPGDSDPAATPPAPDYRAEAAWAALPERADGADVALTEWPGIDQLTASAAVFYVHPTTFLRSEWNATIDDPAIVTATDVGGTRIQASVFNGCCAVYAPRYRQANGLAFTAPNPAGEQAIAVASGDIDAAFIEFLARIGERPFVIAGHSQGAILGARLIRERVAGTPLAARLIAAYLIGAPLRADSVGVPVCASATETGCFVSWHARGPGFEPNGFEFPDPLAERICVNPLTWTADGEPAPARGHRGALFFDVTTPAVQPEFCAAQCVGGALVVTELGELDRDFRSRLLLRAMGPGNYHPIEYQMFYLDLRANAIDRVDAYRGAEAR